MTKVFLSSTSRGLQRYRDAAYKAITRAGYQCIRMEDFGAVDNTPAVECRRRVAEADILVGIIGLHYGSGPPDEAVSFTELEYDEAVNRGMARLIFVVPDDFATAGNERESDETWKRQQSFRERVQIDRVVASFATEDGLALGIVQALHEWSNRQRSTISPEIRDHREHRIVVAALTDHNLKLADALSQELTRQLDEIRELYREGRHAIALDKVRTLRQHAAWKELAPEVQARVLRTLSTYELQADGDPAESARWLDEARALDPDGDDSISRAVLAYRTGSVESALLALDNSKTLPAIHAAAAFQLELGRTAEAEQTLENLPAGIEPDAETTSLRAAVALASADLPKARELIDEAYQQRPRWQSVREFRAIVDFWEAFVPEALHRSNPLMPHPIPPELMRSRHYATPRLRSALGEFEQLRGETADEAQTGWRYRFWCFLCLFHLEPHSGQSKEALQQLLALDWTRPLALLWALAAGVPFDQDRVEDALRDAPATDDSYLDKVGLLCAMVAQKGQIEEAFTLLERTKTRFFAAGAEGQWRYWWVHALLSAGRLDEAKSEAQAEPDSARRRNLLTQCARRAAQAGNSEPLLAALLTSWEEDGEVTDLFELCRLKAQAEDWEFVRGQAAVLLTRMPTDSAIHLVAWALWHGNDADRCLRFLDEHRSSFPGNELPTDLQRKRVGCLRRLGRLNEAVEEAREQHARERCWNSLMTLIEIQSHQGDLVGLVASARELLGFRDGNAVHLLWAAEQIRLKEPELALLLWQRALDIDSDDANFPMHAFMLGQHVGATTGLAPLFLRAKQLADEGRFPMWSVTLKELPDLLQRQHENAQELAERYEKGEIPVHLIGESVRPPLAALFHAIPSANRATPAPWRQMPVLGRHGSRHKAFLPSGYRKQGKLVLDVSALLTAADLEILDTVERHLAPLFLPASLPSFLQEEMRKLRPSQPRRFNAMSAVSERVNVDGIGLLDLPEVEPLPTDDFVRAMGGNWLALIAAAMNDGGALVEFFPVTSNDLEHTPVELPADIAPLVTSVRALVEDLPIDEERRRELVGQLGSVAQDGEGAPVPTARSRLIVNSVIAVALADAGVLSLLQGRYRLEIPRRDWENHENERKQQIANNRTADWLELLIARIQRGLRSGTYVTLPEPAAPREEKDEVGRERLRSGLWELIGFQGTPADLVWVDDRCLSGYPQVNSSPLIGILEVLKLLRRQGLNDQEYFRALSRLRAGNFRYLPLDEDEILHWLQQAPTHDSHVVEIEELRVLRRYWAAVLLDDQRLQMRPAEEQKSEATIIVQSQSAVREALLRIWRDRRLGLRRKKARAGWVLDNLYGGLLHLPHLVPDTGQDQSTYRIGLDIAGLLQLSFSLDAIRPDGTGTSPQHQYVKWVNQTLIEPRLTVDPGSAVPAALTLRQTIVQLLDEFAEKDVPQRRAFRAVVGRFIEAIPDLIRQEIYRDTELMKRLGLAYLTAIEFNGYSFSAELFWRAVNDAIRDGESRLTAVGHRQLILRPPACAEQPIAALDVEPTQGDKPFTLRGEHFGLLSVRSTERLAVLERHRYWVDGLGEPLDVLERRLTAEENPARRIALVEEWRALSAANHYHQVEQVLMSDESTRSQQLLPPSTDALLRFFRLDREALNSGRPFAEVWQDVCLCLIREVGVVQAVVRAVCLPIRLPPPVVAAVREDVDPRALLERLAPHCTAPVSLVHFVDLCLAVAADHPDVLALAQAALARLRGEDNDVEFAFLRTLLSVASHGLAGRQDVRTLPPAGQLLLIWGHALCLQNIIQTHGIVNQEVVSRVAELAQQFPPALFAESADVRTDVAAPEWVSAADIRYHALGVVAGDYPAAVVESLSEVATIQERASHLERGAPDDNQLIFLFRDPTLRRDALGCLFGGQRQVALAPLLGAMTDLFSPANFERALESAVGTLEQTPDADDGWYSLFALAGDGPLPAALAARLPAVTDEVDLLALFLRNPNGAIVLAPLIMRWMSSMKVAEERLLSAVAMWEGELGKEDSLGKESDGFASWMLECAYWLAYREDSPEQADSRFGQVVERLLRRSPALAQTARTALEQLSRRLSASGYKAIHRLAACRT